MKKGFTLVELLGSIVILSIIALVAFPAVLNLLSSSNSKIDSETKNYAIEAARNYVNDHVNDYPKTTNEIKKICISTLKSEGYISDNTYENKEKLLKDKCINVSVTNNNYKFEFDSNCSCS